MITLELFCMSRKKSSTTLPHITLMSVGGRGAAILDTLQHLVSDTVTRVAVGIPQSLTYAKTIEDRITLPVFRDGEDPVRASEAVALVADEVRQTVAGADMVFLMGNLSTPSNAHQVAEISRIIREQGILTCFVGATAFSFEGAAKAADVEVGMSVVTAAVDGMLVVNSEQVIASGSAERGLTQVNQVVEQVISMILDIVRTHGVINIDFADLKTTLQNAGLLFFQSAEAAEVSLDELKSSIFTHSSLTLPQPKNMKRVLYVIYAGSDVLAESVSALGEYIASQVHESARILFGFVADQKMGDRVKVVVIGA